MILHSVSIRDWRNIGRVELDALDAALVVLHGPNRTGKSSIVHAIRCCLFDCDHDSVHASIRNSIPWTTQASPEVTIEFAANGSRYRLMKRFSKRKDGEACLQRQSSGGEWSVVERGKEASREARTVLGCSESDEGLNQLLWLPQGVSGLPDAKTLDGTLRKRFEQVLGRLLTAQDVEFHDLLKQRCGVYFTSTGKESKKSPLAKLRASRESIAESVGDLSRKLEDSESLVAEYDGLQARIFDEQQRVAESERTLATLKEANAAVESKRQALADAQRELAQAREHQEQARSQVEKHAKLRAELAELEGRVHKANSAVDAASDSRNEILAKIGQRTADLKSARRRFEELDQERTLLEEKRQLANVSDQITRLSGNRDECFRLEQQLAECRRELAGIPATDETTLKTLRANRRDADRLRAEVDAAALRLEIETTGDVGLQLTRDAETPDQLELPPGEVRTWQFRQWVELQLASAGTIRVVRGEQDVSLDESARQLHRLDKEFSAALSGCGLDTDDERWLEILAARGERRKQLAQDVAALEQSRVRIAPDGSDAIQRELDRLETERSAVLARSPELVSWEPDVSEIRNAEQTLSKSTAEGRKTESDRAADIEELRGRQRRADDRLSDLKVELATLEEKRSCAQRDLLALGDEFTLQQNDDAAGERVKQAEGRVREFALSPDEEQLEARIAQEQDALRNREARLQDSEKQAHGIRERLKDRSGLHEELAEAETEHARVECELEREELNAAANRLLLETFESCRNERMQRTVGPLENRVLAWASRLGLQEYGTVSFGDNDYLPTGLARRDSETLVALADESYGTVEQLALLIRLAAGQLLARDERHVAILDDPLTHADPHKHRAMLDILNEVTHAAATNGGTALSPLQLLVFTCHPERFDHLRDARHIDLAQKIQRT